MANRGTPSALQPPLEGGLFSEPARGTEGVGSCQEHSAQFRAETEKLRGLLSTRKLCISPLTVYTTWSPLNRLSHTYHLPFTGKICSLLVESIKQTLIIKSSRVNCVMYHGPHSARTCTDEKSCCHPSEQHLHACLTHPSSPTSLLTHTPNDLYRPTHLRFFSPPARLPAGRTFSACLTHVFIKIPFPPLSLCSLQAILMVRTGAFTHLCLPLELLPP